VLAGLILGFGVHFKIYPFIYAPAIVWWMDDDRLSGGRRQPSKDGEGGGKSALAAFLTPARLRLALVSLATFSALNALMYALYGFAFVQHTFLHHVSRLDHRHNFSPYNSQLYLASALPPTGTTTGESPSPMLPLFRVETFAFLPQLLLSTVLIPFVMAKKDLPATMLAQTFAFVTFNKVCTSQVSFLGVFFGERLAPPPSGLTLHPTCCSTFCGT